MQIQKPIPLLFILTVCCCINANAATDSLPPCIKNIAKGELSSYTEYDYKGKRLFSFTTVPKTTTPKYYDSLSSIRYYDSSCQLFCTWMKGGIMGSKMLPHTVEKSKIITINAITFDTVAKKNVNNINNLTDTIGKIALLKKVEWIEENSYDNRFVYRFQNSAKVPGSSQIIFTLPYFDEDGKVITPKKLTGRTFWWHLVGEKFIRTQFRPGYR